MLRTKQIVLGIYLASIPLANWLINNVGTQDAPGLPHTIPVGFGYSAPSGVLAIGISLFARDFIEEQYGRRIALMAIAAGVAMSYFINPAVATASAVAFALGELSDFVVFTKIKKRTLAGAVIASGVIGGVIDSFVFLQLAFGSTQYWQGQVIGKTLVAFAGGVMIWGSHAVSNRLHTKQTTVAG